MRVRVDQILAGYADGDAISSEARAIRSILQTQGFQSDIYSEIQYTSKSLLNDVKDINEFTAGDVVIHHYSIGSPVLENFLTAQARKVLVYHNITPAEYFRPYDPRVTRQLEEAREKLSTVGSRADAVWAKSKFNADELKEQGIPDVKIFPLLFNEADCRYPDDPEVLAKLSGPLKTFLTVGRIAPNKKIEAGIKAFYYYVKKINPYSRLVIVGSGRSCPGYYDLLQIMIGDLDIPNVCFEGFVAAQSLPTYYRCADLFLSTSAHEGYCMPLVEAMYHGVPVVAHQTGGTPEAMGGAGVLYDKLDPAELAVLMDNVSSDSNVRSNVIKSQVQRIIDVKTRRADEELMSLLKPLLP